jgi:hypothetical protein
MREVAPGDLIFSFMDTRILAVGIAQSYCWESPKPEEFGVRVNTGRTQLVTPGGTRAQETL